MKTFVSRSGKSLPLPVKTETDWPPIFESTSTPPVPVFDSDIVEAVTLATEIDQTEKPLAPEDNTTMTRPNPSWTKRELIAYAEEHGIQYSPGECKSKVYAEVTAGMTSQEDNNGDSG